MIIYVVRQDGSTEDDWGKAVAVADDGSIVMGGYRENSSTFVVVNLDADGSFVWQWEVSRGSRGERMEHRKRKITEKKQPVK